MEDQLSRVKYQLAAFRIPEYKEVLSRLRLPKQGKKQVLMDRLLDIFKDNGYGRPGPQPNTVMAARIIEDVYRKLQAAGEAAKLQRKAALSPVLAFHIPPAREELGVEAEGARIGCICGIDVNQGTTMVKCDDESCGVWQHLSCVVIDEKQVEGTEPEMPKQYFCPSCRISKGDPFSFTTAHVLNAVKLRFPSNRGESPLQSVEKAFTVTRAQRDLILLPGYEMQVWAVLLNDKTSFRMHWPQYADVRINGTQIRVTNRPGQQALGANGRDDGANICLAIRDGANRVSCSAYDSRPFAIGIRLIQRKTLAEVIATIPSVETGESVENALARIRRCVGGGQKDAAEDSDSDLEVVSDVVTVNLRCPMTGSRIRVPGRFRPCQHMGNFDLHSYVEIQQRARKWQCPICLVNYALEHLIIDPVYYHIAAEMKDYGEDITDVEMRPDAWWRPKLESKIKPPWRCPFAGRIASPVQSELVQVKPEPMAFQDMPETSNAGRSLKVGMKRDAEGKWKVSGASSGGEPVANGWSGDESTKRLRPEGDACHSHDVSLEHLLFNDTARAHRVSGGSALWGEDAGDGTHAEESSGAGGLKEHRTIQDDGSKQVTESSREVENAGAPQSTAIHPPNLIVLSESEDEDDEDVVVTGKTNRVQQGEGASSGDMSSENGGCRVRTMGAGALRRGPSPVSKPADSLSAGSLNRATHAHDDFVPDPRVVERPSAQEHTLLAPVLAPGGAVPVSGEGEQEVEMVHARGEEAWSSGHEVEEGIPPGEVSFHVPGRVKTMGFGALGAGRGSTERVRTMGLGSGTVPATAVSNSGTQGGGVRTMGLGSKYKPPRPRDSGLSIDMQESPMGSGWHMAQRGNAPRNVSTIGDPDTRVGLGVPNGNVHGSSTLQGSGTFRRQSMAGVLVGTTTVQPGGNSMMPSVNALRPAPKVNGPGSHTGSLPSVRDYPASLLPSGGMSNSRPPLGAASTSGRVNGGEGSHASLNASGGGEMGNLRFDGNLLGQHVHAETEVPAFGNGFISSLRPGLDVNGERDGPSGDEDWPFPEHRGEKATNRWPPASGRSDSEGQPWSDLEAAEGAIQNRAGVLTVNKEMQLHENNGNADRGSFLQPIPLESDSDGDW